jgi:hypothetical protein
MRGRPTPPAPRGAAIAGWPKARRIRSGSRKPVSCATRSIASEEDCKRCRATSIRRRSTAFDGVVPEHELACGLLRDLLTMILRHHGEREIDAGGDPDRRAAHRPPLTLRWNLRDAQLL